MQTSALPLSVIIIVQNEAANLPRCLKVLPKNCEIIVVDSGSTDESINVAKSFGAQVYSNPFLDYSKQKNFALSKATRSWILSVDADEELSADLSNKISSIVSNPASAQTIYSLKRVLVFMGRRMRFGRTIDHPLRLFPKPYASFVGEIHEVLKPVAEIRPIISIEVGFLAHYSYRDLSDYFEKFNRYTNLMAKQRYDKGVGAGMLPVLLLRPVVVFCHRYFLKLGFLDAYPGFVWALLAGFYSFVKYAKLRELYQNGER